MADIPMQITDGPAKADLRKALAKPEEDQVVFVTDRDTFSVSVETMVTSVDGNDFDIEGIIQNGDNAGARFQANYASGGRRGTFEIMSAASDRKPNAIRKD